MSRGTDSTGAAWQNANGIEVQKRPMPATRFVKSTLSVPRRADLCILHTRAATQGSPDCNDNNHPIITGNIVGVHNGWLYNDYDLFRQLGIEDRRIAEVDSEAIFAALAYAGETYVKDAITGEATTRLDKYLGTTSVLEQIEGTAAIAWLDMNERDVLNLARISSSPLVWGQTDAGSLLFASTHSALNDVEQAFPRLKIVHREEAEEGEYFRVVNGCITDFERFEPADTYQYNRYRGTYSGWGYFGGTTNRGNAGTTGASTSTTGATESCGTTPTTTPGNDSDVANIAAAVLADGWADEWNAGKYLTTGTSDGYYRAYKHREQAIDDYMGGLTSDDVTWGKTASELGAYLRPGEWVGLTVNGNYPVYGQLYELPESFPMGEYMIRCFVPNINREAGYEIVFVSRQFYEFTPVVRSAVSEIIAGLQGRAKELADRRNAGRPAALTAGV